jgi:hypothetical protein
MTEAEDEEDWILTEGMARRRHAQEQLAAVELLLLQGHDAEAEATARSSLAGLASSLNWLEDTDEFSEAHLLLDLAGEYVRRTFGCSLHWTGSRYEQRCPVAIAHKRIGFSPEIALAGFNCTICDADAETCEHIAGRVYDGERCGRRARGPMRILAAAMVSRPEQPDARMSAIPLSISDLRAAMPPEWQPGMPLSCDRCLLPCDGVEEFDFAELQQVAAQATDRRPAAGS